MELKQYIECVRKLEIEKHTLANTINVIDRKINSLAIPSRVSREDNKYDKVSSDGIGCAVGLCIVGGIFAIMGINILSVAGGFVQAWGIGFLLVAFGISPLVYLIYQAAKRNKMISEEEVRIEAKYKNDLKYEEYRMNEEKRQKNILIDARQKFKNTYDDTCQTLQLLYNEGVIFPKYQNNLVAVCMFSEYLQSGRCDSLVGHEGAYNIYESEIRMGLILIKLEEIVKKLDQISDNQYMLYSAMNQINNQQKRLVGSLNQVISNQNAQIEQLEYIEYNTRVLKQNSEIELLLK